MNVRYYKTKGGIALVYGEWPTRSLRAKGYRRCITRRNATEYEVRELSGAPRLYAVRYIPLDLEGLVADDRACGVDEGFIELLRRRLTPHPADRAEARAGDGDGTSRAAADV